MSSAARTVLVVIVALITVAVVWAASRIRERPEIVMKADPGSPDAHPLGIKGAPLGTAGCLGAACHGAPARDALEGKFGAATWQSSGSCWVATDPHTAAYSLLTDKPHRQVKVTAQWIMDRYAPGKKATEDSRCLACHSNPTLAERSHKDTQGGAPGPRNVPRREGETDQEYDARIVSLRAEGVSCEACHGNAGGWLRQHTTWEGARDKVYDETGLVKLYDAGERAVACAGCHIGAPADPERGLAVRDMNHDMIAAGHPRLNFDFAEYQRRLPHHWWEKDRTEKGNVPRGSEFQVKAWLVGRVAQAEAACKLLHDRAERSKTDERSPWPEFAEFNCAACHHSLEVADPEKKNLGSSWRGKVLEGRKAGAVPWQTIWPVTPAIGLKPQRPTDLFAKAQHKYEPALRELLGAIENPRPRAAKDVQLQAKTAADALTALRIELSAWPDRAFEEPAKRAFANLQPVAGDLDSGLQTYFGLAAIDRARRDAKPDPAFRAATDAYRLTGVSDAERWEKFQPALKTLLARPDK